MNSRFDHLFSWSEGYLLCLQPVRHLKVHVIKSKLYGNIKVTCITCIIVHTWPLGFRYFWTRHCRDRHNEIPILLHSLKVTWVLYLQRSTLPKLRMTSIKQCTNHYVVPTVRHCGHSVKRRHVWDTGNENTANLSPQSGGGRPIRYQTKIPYGSHHHMENAYFSNQINRDFVVRSPFQTLLRQKINQTRLWNNQKLELNVRRNHQPHTWRLRTLLNLRKLQLNVRRNHQTHTWTLLNHQ